MAHAGRHGPSGVRRRISTYDCQPCSGALTLFCAEGSPGRGFARYRAYGWSGMAAGGVRRHAVPGDHITMFPKPNVERMARPLAQELQQASPLPAEGAARPASSGRC